eukprot:jgi/Botrbrau1/18309/Bobra.0179s0038.1
MGANPWKTPHYGENGNNPFTQVEPEVVQQVDVTPPQPVVTPTPIVVPALPVTGLSERKEADVPAQPEARRRSLVPALPIAKPLPSYPRLPVAGRPYTPCSPIPLVPDAASRLEAFATPLLSSPARTSFQGARGVDPPTGEGQLLNTTGSLETPRQGNNHDGGNPEAGPSTRVEIVVRKLPDQGENEPEWAECKAYLIRTHDGDFYAVPNLKRAVRAKRRRWIEKLLSLPGSRKISFSEKCQLAEAGCQHSTQAKLIPADALKTELPKRGVKPEVVEELTRGVKAAPRRVRIVPDAGITIERIKLSASAFGGDAADEPVIIPRLKMQGGTYWFLARDMKRLLGPGSESGNHSLLARIKRGNGQAASRKATPEEFRFLGVELGVKGGIPMLLDAACIHPALVQREIPKDIIERLQESVVLDPAATAAKQSVYTPSESGPRRLQFEGGEDWKGREAGINSLESVVLPMDESFSAMPVHMTRIHMKDGCFYLSKDVKKLLGPASESSNHALIKGVSRKATKDQFAYLSSILGLSGGIPSLVAASGLAAPLSHRSVPPHIIDFVVNVPRPPEDELASPAHPPPTLMHANPLEGEGANQVGAPSAVPAERPPNRDRAAGFPILDREGFLTTDKIWFPEHYGTTMLGFGSGVRSEPYSLDRIFHREGCFYLGTKLIKILESIGYNVRMRNFERARRPNLSPACWDPSRSLCTTLMQHQLNVHRGHRVPHLVAADCMRALLTPRGIAPDIIDLLEEGSSRPLPSLPAAQCITSNPTDTVVPSGQADNNGVQGLGMPLPTLGSNSYEEWEGADEVNADKGSQSPENSSRSSSLPEEAAAAAMEETDQASNHNGVNHLLQVPDGLTLHYPAHPHVPTQSSSIPSQGSQSTLPEKRSVTQGAHSGSLPPMFGGLKSEPVSFNWEAVTPRNAPQVDWPGEPVRGTPSSPHATPDDGDPGVNAPAGNLQAALARLNVPREASLPQAAGPGGVYLKVPDVAGNVTDPDRVSPHGASGAKRTFSSVFGGESGSEQPPLNAADLPNDKRPRLQLSSEALGDGPQDKAGEGMRDAEHADTGRVEPGTVASGLAAAPQGVLCQGTNLPDSLAGAVMPKQEPEACGHMPGPLPEQQGRQQQTGGGRSNVFVYGAVVLEELDVEDSSVPAPAAG